MAWINTKGSKPHTHAVREGWKYNRFKWFYNLKAWKVIRRLILEEEPLCRVCMEKGIDTFAQEVDHITPLSVLINQATTKGQFIQMATDIEGLQPLCSPCHASKRGKESIDALNKKRPRSERK